MNGKNNNIQYNNIENKKYQTGYKKGIKYIEQILREEIKNDFKTDKNIYIYDKILLKYNIVEIFVVFLSNTTYNKREIDITFLIIIKEDYPKIAPLIFCLTDFNQKFDIFDVRNIQKNLIQNWSDNIKLSELIKKIPILIESIDYQINNKLMPDIGEYYINNVNIIYHQLFI